MGINSGFKGLMFILLWPT